MKLKRYILGLLISVTTDTVIQKTPTGFYFCTLLDKYILQMLLILKKVYKNRQIFLAVPIIYQRSTWSPASLFATRGRRKRFFKIALETRLTSVKIIKGLLNPCSTKRKGCRNECVRLKKRLSKVWGILHHGRKGQVHNKNVTYCFHEFWSFFYCFLS